MCTEERMPVWHALFYHVSLFLSFCCFVRFRNIFRIEEPSTSSTDANLLGQDLERLLVVVTTKNLNGILAPNCLRNFVPRKLNTVPTEMKPFLKWK